MSIYTVCNPAINGCTSSNYIIDVLIYDNNKPIEINTSHYDKKCNYIAFVAFSNDYPSVSISWNITSDYNNILYKYKNDHKDKFIELAIQSFKREYPTYEPNKNWN